MAEQFLLISGLPTGPTPLVGTELLEIQNGTSEGASQQTTAAAIAQIALRQSVQSIQVGTGGVVVDSTNPNSPKVSIPTPAPGRLMSIDETNPEAPIYNCTVPTDGGISAAYGSPGGAVLAVNAAISGIATANYQITGWALQCSPSGSITVDFRTGILGNAPTSIVGSGTKLQIASSTTGSGNVSGWTSTIVSQGQVIEVVVTAVTNVEWFNLALFGTRM